MKTCDVIGCEYNVFGTDKNTGKKFCKPHQYMRTDIVRGIKNSSVKQRNEKLSRNKLGFNPFQWGYEDELTMFNAIWKEREHLSQVSKHDLNKEKIYLAMFAHVLNKKDYPLFRYNPDNIFLVRPLEHVLLDHGSASARRNYEKENPSANFGLFYKRKELLLAEYPKNVIPRVKNLSA